MTHNGAELTPGASFLNGGCGLHTSKHNCSITNFCARTINNFHKEGEMLDHNCFSPLGHLCKFILLHFPLTSCPAALHWLYFEALWNVCSKHICRRVLAGAFCSPCCLRLVLGGWVLSSPLVLCPLPWGETLCWVVRLWFALVEWQPTL